MEKVDKKEENANEFFRINNKIFEELEDEKSLLYYRNFAMFIEKRRVLWWMNFIQMNYQYGTDYMTDMINEYKKRNIMV